MPRAKHYYNSDEWVRVLDAYGISNAQAASAAKVSVETIYNILSASTSSCRLDTKRKLTEGLSSLGVSREDVESLFRSSP